jgi:hypothetical protein
LISQNTAPSSYGITAQAIRARIKPKIGAIIKIAKFE